MTTQTLTVRTVKSQFAVRGVGGLRGMFPVGLMRSWPKRFDDANNDGRRTFHNFRRISHFNEHKLPPKAEEFRRVSTGL